MLSRYGLRIGRNVFLLAIVLFFLFPFVWVLMMSFQTNQTILRSTPALLFKPTLDNYTTLISGQLGSGVGTMTTIQMRKHPRRTYGSGRLP